MKKKMVWLFSAAVMMAGMLFATPSTTKADEDVKIADGIYIGTVYVGGMTEEEANAAISEYTAISNSLLEL